MQMRLLVVRLAIVAALVPPLASCALYDRVLANKTIKEAHTFYQRGDFQRASEGYEEVLAAASAEVVAADANLTPVYFYLGNSYDNLYRPGRRGEPENDALLERAIQNYELAAQTLTHDPPLRRLSMQYLFAAYGPDKLNDPNRGEPVLQRMIDVDPGDVENYFALARLYEDAGEYELAEETLLKVKGSSPDDVLVYMQLDAFYTRIGEFDKSMEALQERATREPNNPEAFYTISTRYWEKAFRDFRLGEEEKRQHIMSGLEAADKAIALKDDYAEALTYKNILLRLQANMEKDLDVQKRLISQADELRDRAEELIKQRTAAAAAPAAQ